MQHNSTVSTCAVMYCIHMVTHVLHVWHRGIRVAQYVRRLRIHDPHMTMYGVEHIIAHKWDNHYIETCILGDTCRNMYTAENYCVFSSFGMDTQLSS